MRQASFYFPPKKRWGHFFLFFISLETYEAPCFVHFKYKNVDILILTYEYNKWDHFFFIQVWKKTDL